MKAVVLAAAVCAAALSLCREGASLTVLVDSFREECFQEEVATGVSLSGGFEVLAGSQESIDYKVLCVLFCVCFVVCVFVCVFVFGSLCVGQLHVCVCVCVTAQCV